MKTYFIISALFVCMLLSCTGTVSAKEIMVGPGYGNTTITAALANASNGDIITVTDGIYTENVDVTKAVTIRSQNGSSNTNIKASSGSDHIFNVSVDNVAISGFNITGASGSSKAGIYLDDVSGCTLTNNTASDNYYGIHLYSNSASNTLTNNMASGNNYGIYLSYSANNTLTNNTASNNSDYGISLSSSTNNTLTNNTASGNRLGIFLYSNSASNTLTNNMASSNRCGISLSSSASNTLTNNTASDNICGISLSSSDNNTLTNNTANNGDVGIYLDSSASNTLTNNTASDNNYGIDLSSSASNTLTGNMMSQNEYNLRVQSSVLTYYLNDIDTSNLVNSKPVYYLTNSSDAVVPSNAGVVYAINCTNVSMQDINITNEYYGVLFYETDNSTIENATISECNYGISLSSSASNTLTNNTASNNSYYGIYLDSSASNTLTGNTASNNSYHGIYLYSNSASNTLTNNTASNNSDRGIYLYSSASNTLTNNTASNNSYYGIYLFNSASNTLTNNTASNNSYYGISLNSNSASNTLTGNTASNNSERGIYLSSSASNTLTNNTASNNSNYGIYLESSASNTLTGNTASNNSYYGIYLSSSDSNTLTNNTANNGNIGIYLYSSASNTLTNNTASNNSNFGIYLSSSASNTLTNNQVDNNTPYDLRVYSSANNLINPLILGDDLAELTFTSDSSTVEILRNETNANNFSGKTNINGYIEINSVLSSMNMSLFYDDTGMSSIDEATIALYKFSGTEWNEVQNTILDTSSNTLSVNLTGFGTFALFNGSGTSTITTTTTTSSSSGTRASVSQGQSPDIVERSASSVKRITGGSEVNYDFSDSGTPVLGVSFDAKKDKGLVVSKVQVLSSAPEGVPVSSGNSYQMMSIDVGSEGTISSDSADNVMIHFKVSKQWIEENNIDVSTIRMNRYHGEQWNDLPTYQEREDNEYFYFYAETPGFSVFNVVGDEISAAYEQVPASAGSEEVEEPVEEPVEEKETKNTPGFTILAGIMFVSFAVLVRKR